MNTKKNKYSFRIYSISYTCIQWERERTAQSRGAKKLEKNYMMHKWSPKHSRTSPCDIAMRQAIMLINDWIKLIYDFSRSNTTTSR